MKYALRVAALWRGTLVQERSLTSGRVTLGGRAGVLLPDEEEGVTLATIGVDTPYATIPLRGDMCGRVIRDGVVHALRCDVPTDLRPGEAAILKLDDVSVYLQWVELDVRDLQVSRRGAKYDGRWGRTGALASALLVSVVVHATLLMLTFLHDRPTVEQKQTRMRELLVRVDPSEMPAFGGGTEDCGEQAVPGENGRAEPRALVFADPATVLREVFGMRGVYRPFAEFPVLPASFRDSTEWPGAGARELCCHCDRPGSELNEFWEEWGLREHAAAGTREPRWADWQQPGAGLRRGRAFDCRSIDGQSDRAPHRVRFRSASTEGGSLRTTQIERSVRRHGRGMRACYERGLVETPTLAGSLTFRWTIAPNGRVSGAQVVGSELDSDAVESCALREIRRMRFDAAAGETVVTQPAVFGPA